MEYYRMNANNVSLILHSGLFLIALTDFVFLVFVKNHSYIVITTGFLPRILEFLRDNRRLTLQREASSVVAAIAAGTSEHIQILVRYGIISKLVRLIHSASNSVLKNVIEALGNIAHDSAEHRNLILRHGFLQKLSRRISADFLKPSRLPMLRASGRTIRNIFRWRPCPEWKHAQMAIKCLSFMMVSDDEQILYNSCWIFFALSDEDYVVNTAPHIAELKSSGSLKRLVNLLHHNNYQIRYASVRIIGNIVLGRDAQTQYVLDLGVLKVLHKLMESDKRSMRTQVCNCLTNITGGTSAYTVAYTDAVIAIDIFPSLINILRNDEYTTASIWAFWSISNVVQGGLHHQVMYLVDRSVIHALCMFSRKIRSGNLMIGGVFRLLIMIAKIIAEQQSDDVENQLEEILSKVRKIRIRMPRQRLECWQCGLSMKDRPQFTCSDCERPTYCERRCQKRHWLRHRMDCFHQSWISENWSTLMASKYVR